MATATASPAEAEGAALDGGAFAARVYAELVHLKEDDALLSLPPAPLERFLAEKGAFAVAQQGGALTQPQARHLELLAKLYRRKGRDALAARVYFALAERDAAGAAVPLEERAALLDVAMRALTDADATYAKTNQDENKNANVADTTNTYPPTVSTSEDTAFFETLDGKIKVLAFQTRARRVSGARARRRDVRGGGGGARGGGGPRARAAPAERHVQRLRAPRGDVGPVSGDAALRRVQGPGRRPDRRRARALGRRARRSRGGGVRRGDVDAAARAACAAAASLGPKLFPSDAAFPVAHVALRLELLAAGLWCPERGEQQSENGGEAVRSSQKMGAQLLDDALVAETVLRATRDSFEAAHAAYDRLLAAPHAMHRAHHDRRMQAHARHLQTPALRLRLLRSALRVLRRWEGSTAEREPEPARGFGAYGGGNRARAPRSRTSARGTPARHAGCCRCPRASRAPPRRWRRSLRRWEGDSRRRDARTGTGKLSGRSK